MRSSDLSALSDVLASVLDEGALDDHSRERLASLYRWASRAAAARTAQPHVRADDDDDTWFRAWSDHIGALPTVVGCFTPWIQPLGEARIVWLDEFDAMSDRAVLALPGVGPKTLAKLRATLDTYYWRSDECASRQMWSRARDRLRGVTEYPYLKEGERERVLAGIGLAERVLAEAGAPLRDPKAARMVP